MTSSDQDSEGTFQSRRDEENNTETPLLGRNTNAASQEDKNKFSIGFLIALTCINGGLQVFFSTVMANLAVGPLPFFPQ